MIRQIKWYGVSEHWMPYSDENLAEVVKGFLKEISEPAKIQLSYCWQTDHDVILWVIVSKEHPDYRIDKNKNVWVNQYHLLHDTEDEIQKDSHRIKQMLKQQFPKLRVTSRLTLR